MQIRVLPEIPMKNYDDMTSEEKVAMAQTFIKPLMRPMHYALRGKLLAYSMGISVDISDEEWKQAEELGFVEPLESKTE